MTKEGRIKRCDSFWYVVCLK